jgi:hypothetical protein
MVQRPSNAARIRILIPQGGVVQGRAGSWGKLANHESPSGAAPDSTVQHGNGALVRTPEGPPAPAFPPRDSRCWFYSGSRFCSVFSSGPTLRRL